MAKMVNEIENELFNSVVSNLDDCEKSLRPKTLDDFIGQKKFVENLRIYIEAAKKRDEPLDHIILSGPPGLGKTTLASIVSNEMGVNFKSTSAPILEKTGDLAAILTDIQEGDIFFIDEIHRLKKNVEEILYSAMEDFAIDLIIGQGPSAKTIKISLSPFTMIGATTRSGLISSPLLARFGIHEKLDFYSINEMIMIIKRSARILEIEIEDDAADILAKCSRGTPRIANRILRRVRDFAQIKGTGKINKEIACKSLERLNIDSLGLNKTDVRLLDVLINHYDGGPAGCKTLAISLGEEPDTIEEVYEPFLIQLGFLKRTLRGRVATKKAYLHLGLAYNESTEKTLFDS